MEDNEFKWTVFVKCFTFNHAPFIVDAMNGFTMQQTTFPYICCIVDDASTDGEPEVIRKYLKENFDLEDKSVVRNEETDDYVLTFARHITNLNCFFAVFYLKYNHYKKKSKRPYFAQWRDKAKYVAICEGDDYWIDPLKLQKQVDFLESHPDYTMCFHSAKVHWANGCKKDQIFYEAEDREYCGREIFENWIVATASSLFQTKVLSSEIYKKRLNNKKIIYGDTPLFLCCATNGKVYGMSDIMSIYNRHEGSVMYGVASYEHMEKRGWHFYNIYKVFGTEYKDISEKKAIKSFISAFFHSFLDKKSSIRFYFLKNAFSISIRQATVEFFLYLYSRLFGNIKL